MMGEEMVGEFRLRSSTLSGIRCFRSGSSREGYICVVRCGKIDIHALSLTFPGNRPHMVAGYYCQ